MPKILFNLLKTSLIQGLFVFIDTSYFTICYLFLCFNLRNTRITSQYSLGITYFFQKEAIFYCIIIYGESNNLCVSLFRRQFWLKYLKCTLQKPHYSKKQSEHYLKVLSSTLDIKKSFKIQSEALKIYSTRLLQSMFTGLFSIIFNQISTL